MRRTREGTAGPERRQLLALAFVCYAATLASLVAFGYSLAVLALAAASHQVEALYLSGGGLLP